MWSWHETELASGRGAPAEARAWLGFTFGLLGLVAIDIEVVTAELILAVLETGSLGDNDTIGFSADRPPGAVHIEVSAPSGFELSADCTGFLDERTSAWGDVTEDGLRTIWF